MIPRPPFSPMCKRLHWLLGYLRMSECEESGNQPTREFCIRNTVLLKSRLEGFDFCSGNEMQSFHCSQLLWPSSH